MVGPALASPVLVAGRLVAWSLAISNIREAGGRAQALREAVRVLRPGSTARYFST